MIKRLEENYLGSNLVWSREEIQQFSVMKRECSRAENGSRRTDPRDILQKELNQGLTESRTPGGKRKGMTFNIDLELDTL